MSSFKQPNWFICFIVTIDINIIGVKLIHAHWNKEWLWIYFKWWIACYFGVRVEYDKCIDDIYKGKIIKGVE